MQPIQFVYPNGGRRAVTFSYDDGRTFDRELVEIFNRRKMKATFHLNSGRLGEKGFVRADEVKALYAGHEVASHTVTHPHLSQQPPEARVSEITDDRAALENLAGYPVTGFSYPFGDYGGGVPTLAQTCGLSYARTINSHGDFYWPEDFYRWQPTCHHDNAEKSLTAFARERSHHCLDLFYIWGHSYELENNWDFIENLCARLNEIPSLWKATNIEVLTYIQAVRSLRFSADGTTVVNPSATPVYIRSRDALIEITPARKIEFIAD